MINWFPGHMNKTLKDMQSNAKLCDCFVYVLDARCPLSCINPEFLKVVKDKPVIFVLNKADLVENDAVKYFIKYFNNLGHECVSLNATVSGNSKIIINTIRKIFSERLEKNRQNRVTFVMRAMIIGIPNSGKSTIVNNLCNKGQAITGNKAGVTRSKQWVKVGNDIEFMDTPGVLLPNFDDEDKAYNLAFVGSVRDDVLNLTDICEHLIARLREINVNILKTKYGVNFDEDTLNIDILSQIGKKRGCLIKGGEIDMERTTKILLTDFRAGKLGKICLEKVWFKMIDTIKIFEHDKKFLNENVKLIAGIDEVGRGPLAGPVVTACVVMPYDTMLDGVFDSKKVTKKNRERLYDEIINTAISYSISVKDQNVIDEINILEATKMGMKECFNNLSCSPDILFIDAVKLNICDNEHAIIKGDATSYAIACASIVAKVYRDRLMIEYSKIYPNYDFENNVGYGTKKHIEAIKQHGITPIHRLSFLSKIIGEEECKKISLDRAVK